MNRDTRIDNGNSTFPGDPSPEEQGRRDWAEFDRKYRRCVEHNRARYFCGCAFRDAGPLADEETP